MRYRERKEQAARVIKDDEIAGTYQECRAQNWETIILELETVTPIYGGGVNAGQPDLLAPLRPRAIRNGLKHWWWLLNRYKFDNSEELFLEMGRIWGAASYDNTDAASCDASSSVQVVLSDIGELPEVFPFAPYRVEGRTLKLCLDNPSVYALFGAKGSLKSRHDLNAQPVLLNRLSELQANLGLQADNGGPNRYFEQGWVQFQKAVGKEQGLFENGNPPKLPHCLIRHGLTFTLKISINKSLGEESREGVMRAVKAWISVGGIGARTSRGLGRIKLVTDENGFGLATLEDLILHLEGAWVDGEWATEAHPSAISAWLAGIECYRQFRQTRRPEHGRSFLPKADVIRATTGEDLLAGHKTIHPGSPCPRFNNGLTVYGSPGEYEDDLWLTPELFFGAPIVVDFMKEHEPPKTSLLLAKADVVKERYASPLLVVPVCLGQRWHSAAIVLRHEDDLKDMSVAIRREGAKNPYPYPKLSRDYWWPGKAGNTTQRVAFESVARDGERNPLKNASKGTDDGNYSPLGVFLNYWWLTHNRQQRAQP